MKWIRTAFIILNLSLISCSIFGQEPLTRNISGFSGISVYGNIRIELYKSDSPLLEITLKDLPLENLTTEVIDGILNIRTRTGSPKNSSAKVKVMYSELKDLTVASGALIVSADILTGKMINFTARSGGKMELELEMEELKAEVVQGAILVFTGEVKKQEVTVNTGATYSAYKLEAEESYVRSSAGATAKVKASKFIDAKSTAGGFIGFIGDPESDFSKTVLGGEIRKYKTEEAAGIN